MIFADGSQVGLTNLHGLAERADSESTLLSIAMNIDRREKAARA